MTGAAGRRAGYCRHTEPDWARHVRDPDAGVPLFAACRLLLKDGEPVDDPRTIACGFWGRQSECPLYEGPGRAAAVAPFREPLFAPSLETPMTARQMVAARLSADGYARRGPLTDGLRQRRRASGALIGVVLALGALAFWLLR